MIKCTQCGNINATGAMQCQSCGAPLSSMVDGGMSPKPASLGQPELPAWLESLRAGEHSSSPANTAASFSATDIVNEDSLPSWMRAQRNEARDNTGATPPVSLRPSSLPGPTTEGEHQLGTGISARSLLDEQALPSWMREGQQSGPVPAQEKIAASSLVQSENMPDWMKSLHKDQAPFPGVTGTGSAISPASQSRSSQGLSSTSQTPAFPPQRSAGGSAFDLQSQPSSALPGQSGFSARDLIDPQSLPSWMAQQGERPAQSTQPSPGLQAEPLHNPGQAGFSARDLIDHQSLPSWMTQQSERPGQPVQPSPGLQAEPLHNPDQAGFSARDLIDHQSLPSWMTQQGERPGQPVQPPPVSQPNTSRNSGQPAPGQTFPASSLLDVNALPTWLRENGQGGGIHEQFGSPANQSFQALSTTPPAPTFGGNIPASSLIDANSAPEWMHQVDPQQRFGTPSQSEPALPVVPNTPQPYTYARPPKVENVRVPNRPRHEMSPNENSEVAANVFSSMLGVASAAPNYPKSSSQPQSSYQQGLPENPAQPNMGYPMSQSAMPPYSSPNYAGPGMGAIPNTPSMSPNMPQGYTPGKTSGSSYQGGMSSSQMGNPPSANMSYTSNSVGSPYGQRADDAANEQKKAKKRGLFGAILEWLTH